MEAIQEAILFLRQYSWPGNIRQLYNVLLQAAIMREGDTIQKSDLVGLTQDASPQNASLLDHPLGEGFSLPKLLKEIQHHYLERAMKEAEGKTTNAARLLGMKNYQTLENQLKRLGLDKVKR